MSVKQSAAKTTARASKRTTAPSASTPEIASTAASWEAVEAAYFQSQRIERDTFRARMKAAHAVSETLPRADQANWPMIMRRPEVAPLAAAENAAQAAHRAAEMALCVTPAPDWRAWALKFRVAAEHVDDLLSPVCSSDWKVSKKREADFPGSGLGALVHHFALAAHLGALKTEEVDSLPEKLAKVAAQAGVVMRTTDDATLPEVGFSHLYDDAKRLVTNPPQAGGAAPSPVADPDDGAWSAARAAYLVASQLHDATEEDGTPAFEETFLGKCRALMAYTQTPTPDLRSLATMLRDAINFDVADEINGDVDDPAILQKMLDHDEASENYLAMAYQHIRRLAGDTGPFLEPRRALPTTRGETDAEFDARISTMPADGLLLKMGADMEQRWAAEREVASRPDVSNADLTEACDHTSEIVERIHRMHASTVDGFRVKARAVAWHRCAHDSKFADEEDGSPRSDTRAAANLVDALLSGPPSNDNKELIALGALFKVASREAFLLEGCTNYPIPADIQTRIDVVNADLDHVRERSRELRATTPAALRVKAVIAADYQPNSDTDEYSERPYTLDRSLVADVLGLPSTNMDAHAMDAWWVAEGFRPTNETIAVEHEAAVGALRKPEITRALEHLKAAMEADPVLAIHVRRQAEIYAKARA